MSDVGTLENDGFGRKLVQVRRVNLDASVASEHVGSLLVWQKKDQIRLASCGHAFFWSGTKSALINICNRQLCSPLPSQGGGLG